MPDRPPAAESLEAALAPLLDRVGGQVVRRQPAPGDVPVVWDGEIVFHVRLDAGAGEQGGTDLSDGLARLLTDVEEELGGPLAALSRADKQHAVRLLEERGAFEMRRSAETVAEALGLTRFTVYNYLNRVRGDVAEASG
jgi:DNA invertase Pin-like site-specific DNA recombinase